MPALRPFLFLLWSLAPLLALARERTYHLDSRPSGAEVYINAERVGTTPYTYTYTRAPQHGLVVELRMEGRESRTVDLGPILRASFTVEHPLVIELYRKYDRDEEPVELPFLTLVDQVRSAKGVYGKCDGHNITRDSRELRDRDYPDMLTNAFVNGARGTYAMAMNVRKGTERGDDLLARAKLCVQPVMKDLLLDLEDHYDARYGTVQVKMEWRFLSTANDSVLFTTERTSTYCVFGEYPGQVLNNALRDAARQLIDEEEGLRDRLVKIHQEGLLSGKGEQVMLERPVPIAFEGRREMLAALVKGVVTIKTTDGFGSGFLVTNDGYILTNAHVVDKDRKVTVRFNQGFSLESEVVKVNRDFDLALVHAPGTDLPALTLGDDSLLLIGEELFAIGTPLEEQLNQTVTRGILSGRREFVGRSFLQTDVAINPGNSGGPVLDGSGKVVGIATLKIKETGVQGIGFAVPIRTALEMLNIGMSDR